MTTGNVPGGTSGPEQGQAPRHIPVLLREVLDALAPEDDQLIIDGTFGAGGYTSALLDAARCRVIAFDRDDTAIARAEPTLKRYGERLRLVHAPFSDMEDAARQARADMGLADSAGAFADGVVLDIGVSSMQLDEAERGFSFQHDGPLDMRMGRDGDSAADFINHADETEIANVIYVFGDEKRSRAIARAIVKKRASEPFTRTRELADLVLRVFHGRKADGKHPATRTFQALRIHVNDELGELARGLTAAERILKPDGRLVVVTFHSLEDRIVKRFLALRSGKESRGSRHLPDPRLAANSIQSEQSSFRLVNNRPLTPCQGELDVNPRARSARLRAAVRTAFEPWPFDGEAIGLPVPDPR